jgi:hypothetical protein
VAGSLPADLAAEAGFVTSGLNVFEQAKEVEQHRSEEIPVFGSATEETAEPESIALDFIDIDDSEIALAAGGNVETETEVGFDLEERQECLVDEFSDFILAVGFAVGRESAEPLDDLGVFEMDTNDVIIAPAVFDRGPFDDVIGGFTCGSAEVRLLENLFIASAGAAVLEELFAGKLGTGGVVDALDQAHFDGIGHTDTEIQIPRAGGILDFGFLIFYWGVGRANHLTLALSPSGGEGIGSEMLGQTSCLDAVRQRSSGGEGISSVMLGRD